MVIRWMTDLEKVVLLTVALVIVIAGTAWLTTPPMVISMAFILGGLYFLYRSAVYAREYLRGPPAAEGEKRADKQQGGGPQEGEDGSAEAAELERDHEQVQHG